MSKKTLNLSIEEDIKRRAKKIAKERGISVSQFFEELVSQQEDPDDYTPKPGSVAYKLMTLIPESEKKDNYDYDEIRYKALKDKYDLE